MSELITVSDYVKFPINGRPACLYDGYRVVFILRDRAFAGQDRFVIWCSNGNGLLKRVGARYPGVILTVVSN